MKRLFKYSLIIILFLVFNNVNAINYDKMCGIVFSKDYKIVVMFETNGGEQIQNLTFDNIDDIKLPIPIKKGYKFVGWYSNDNLTNKFDLDDVALYPYSNGCNVTKAYTKVYAKWEKDKSCDIPDEYNVKIKFITNSEDKFDDIVIKMGMENKQVDLPVPSKDNYYFIGWYGDSDYRVLINDTTISPEVIYSKVKTKYVSDDNCSFDKVGKLYAKFIDNKELMYMIIDYVDNSFYMINDYFNYEK